MRGLLIFLSDLSPLTCFRNWMRGHRLVLESISRDGVEKYCCTQCGLAFAYYRGGLPVVWDDKFEAEVVKLNSGL